MTASAATTTPLTAPRSAWGNKSVDRVIVPAFLFWKDPAADLARYGEDVIAQVG